jgi:hypothetical protein
MSSNDVILYQMILIEFFSKLLHLIGTIINTIINTIIDAIIDKPKMTVKTFRRNSVYFR